MPRTSSLRRTAVALTVGAVLLTGCGDDGEAAAPASPSPVATVTPSPAPSPSPSPSPSPIDVATVPAEIDVAYVQAVLDELNRIETEAFRDVAATGEFSERFHALMKSIHTPADADRQIGGFKEFVGVDGLADPPGLMVSEVQQLLTATPECIEAEIVHDVTPLLAPDVELDVEQPYEVKLVRSEPNDLNPTAWVIDHIGPFHIEEPCGG